MKDATRIRIAALATALFIGLLTAGGLAVRAGDAPRPPAAAPAQSAQSAQPSLAGVGDDDGAQAPDAAGFTELDDD